MRPKMTQAIFPVLLLLSACSKEKAIKDLVVTEDDKALYAMGQLYARKVDYLTLTDKEMEVLFRGFRDWTIKQKSEIPEAESRISVQRYLDKKMAETARIEKAKGVQFYEKYVSSGAMKTSSGLAYKVIKAGSIKKPKAKDSVEVHYHGTFIDGRVFDSSVDRKQKITFPLKGVIPGWTEGLQLIGEGGEIELVVPSELGYGERGNAPVIPGGATLVFRIQLFKVIEGKS